MDLNTALVLFILAAIVVYFLARGVGIRFFSSLILSLLVGYFLLITIYPVQAANAINPSWNEILYFLIILLVTILTLIYVLMKIFQDREVRVVDQAYPPLGI